MRKYCVYGLMLGMLMAGWASAEVIGIDRFEYTDGPVVDLSGGTYWDWNNETKAHTNAKSRWTGGPSVESGALITNGNSTRRTYGGIDDAGYRLAAFRGNGQVYCSVKVTPLADQSWMGVSAYDFGNERIFYGMPGTGAGLGSFGVLVYDGSTVRIDRQVVLNQTYHLICALDFDGDQVRMWIDPDADDWDNGSGDNSADVKVAYTFTNWNTAFRLGSGGQTRWDDIKIATTFADVSPKAAFNPSPAQGQENVSLSATLSWDPARDVENPSQPDPDIKTHKLYGNFANPADPNVFFVAEIPNSGARAQYGPLTLVRDATYYWRVDEVLADANEITGTLWSFESLPSIPVVNPSSPVDQVVHPGEAAQFTAVATNPFEGYETEVSYRWYSVATGAPLTEGAKFSGVASATLTVADVQVADEGSFFCRVSNAYGNTASADTPSARLIAKRILHYWPLDNDPNDVIGGLEGTLVGAPVLAEGKVGNAYQFASTEYIKLPVFDRPDYFTVTGWVKTTGSGERHIWAWTNDISEPTYANQRAMLFRLNGGSVQYGENGIAPVGWLSVTGAGGLNNGEYQFVAMTYNRGQVRLYSNGLQTGSGSTAASLGMTATQLSIANMGDRAPASHSFNGAIDEVRFFNYPLDRYEIADIYLDTVGGSVCMDGYPTYDYNRDCIVDLDDLSTFIGQWLLDNRYWGQPQ